MRTRWTCLVFLLSLVIGSCGISEKGNELPPADPKIIPSENPTGNPLQLESTHEPTEMPATPPVEKFVELAKKDLAGRLGVDADKINLVKTAEKLWLNAALGCPRPGVFYQSGRVPGFQIWLEVDGTEYVYNTDFTGTVILCPELNPHAPNSNNDPTPGVPIQ
jgi:hypothetical protein